MNNIDRMQILTYIFRGILNSIMIPDFFNKTSKRCFQLLKNVDI